MSDTNLLQAIEAIGRDKGIERDVIIKALEEAYAAASRKVMKSRENLVSVFNEETGSFGVFAKKRVVPEVTDEAVEISLEDALEIDQSADFDQELFFARDVPELGRIAAQAAKQVIYQKVKEAEREKIYNEYIDRVGDLVNGIVKRVERGDLVVDMGASEAAIPRREQMRNEHYNTGDRVRAIIVDVERSGKGPQVVLSRTDPRLVMKLFEMEVPEIYDGTVRIVSVGRDAGERTKIGVQSRDRDVDPVGACVGMKGNRVQSVIRELRGEKIDIVQFHEDSLNFVREALKPAAVNRVALKDESKREVEVIVADDQLSLAIGKRGQNVRLAGRLVGWRIDVKSESEKRAEIDAEQDARSRARDMFGRLGVEDPVVDALIEAGFRDVDQLVAADLEDLTLVPGIDIDLSLHIHDQAETLADQIREEERQAKILSEQMAASASRVDEEMAGVAEIFARGSAPSSSDDDLSSVLGDTAPTTVSSPEDSDASSEAGEGHDTDADAEESAEGKAPSDESEKPREE